MTEGLPFDGSVSEWKAFADGNFQDIDTWVSENEGIMMTTEQICLSYRWTAMGFIYSFQRPLISIILSGQLMVEKSWKL